MAHQNAEAASATPRFRVFVERPHEQGFYLFVRAATPGDAIRAVTAMVDTTSARLVVEPAGIDKAHELAMLASRRLVDAYVRGWKTGGSIDWSDLDDAHAAARQALAEAGEGASGGNDGAIQ